MLNVDHEIGIVTYSTPASEHFDEYFQWFAGSKMISVVTNEGDRTVDTMHTKAVPTIEQFKTACITYSEEHHAPFIG